MTWPALIAGVLVAASGRWLHYALLLGLILAYGAVLASLGLALATWVSRPGRAVALAVTIYAVFSIGSISLIFLLDMGHFWGRYLCMLSPVWHVLGRLRNNRHSDLARSKRGLAGNVILRPGPVRYRRDPIRRYGSDLQPLPGSSCKEAGRTITVSATNTEGSDNHLLTPHISSKPSL